LNDARTNESQKLHATSSAVALAPRWAIAQSTPAPAKASQPPAADHNVPVNTTKLYDNVYLLQGAGGNMALQTGPEGNILIDASYAVAVPRILEAIATVSHDRADALINTHWHQDHTATRGCTPPVSPSVPIRIPASGSPHRRR
jgi:glyoxylase-like metal-dependent hydrolase (beta-lactamase superfamily II)